MTRKLSLDIESLAITSFDTGDGHTLRGTVDAHEDHAVCPYSKTDSCPATKSFCPSFDVSCEV
jgi:hypothetical protein